MTKTWAVKPIQEAKDLIFFSSFTEQTVEAVLKKERFDCSLENIPKNLKKNQFLNQKKLMLLQVTDQDSACRLKYSFNYKHTTVNLL